MSFVKCCKHKRKASSYNIIPQDGYINVIMNVIDNLCPVCGGYVVELERTDAKGITSTITRKNSVGYELFDKLENSIISKIKNSNIITSGFYLNYNEHGKKKRCYSNFSTLKIGRTDNGLGINKYIEKKKFLKNAI